MFVSYITKVKLCKHFVLSLDLHHALMRPNWVCRWCNDVVDALVVSLLILWNIRVIMMAPFLEGKRSLFSWVIVHLTFAFLTHSSGIYISREIPSHSIPVHLSNWGMIWSSCLMCWPVYFLEIRVAKPCNVMLKLPLFYYPLLPVCLSVSGTHVL